MWELEIGFNMDYAPTQTGWKIERYESKVICIEVLETIKVPKYDLKSSSQLPYFIYCRPVK